MRRICVYCGSSTGTNPLFEPAAAELGTRLANEGIGVVYGGASVGLMGAVADAALSAGGNVIGVIPQFLANLEISHNGLTELHVVQSMHERKSLMADLADGFVALPGGFGTLEEITEALTWSQLRFHDKPCALLNVAGYFEHLLNFLDHASAQGFIRGPHRDMLLVSKSVNELIVAIDSYAAPTIVKLPLEKRI